MYDNIPDITERTNMSTFKKDLDALIITTKIGALLEVKNKIQEEIDELERQKEVDDEIPF